MTLAVGLLGLAEDCGEREEEDEGSPQGFAGNAGPVKSAVMPRCAVATSRDPKGAMDLEVCTKLSKRDDG